MCSTRVEKTFFSDRVLFFLEQKSCTEDDGIILNFLKKTRDLNPDDRAIALEEDEAFAAVHKNHASTGQTETPDLQDEVNLHFVCLIQKGDRLYELDGNKKQPIDHGPCTSFLHVS